MNDKKMVRLVGKSGNPHSFGLIVDGKIIPFYELQLNVKVGEVVTLTATVPVDLVDVALLQENTELKFVPLEGDIKVNEPLNISSQELEAEYDNREDNR